MKQEDIDKIETLIGYLKYFYDNSTPLTHIDELSDVIKEANEWVNDLKQLL
jgi:hypothetical protein